MTTPPRSSRRRFLSSTLMGTVGVGMLAACSTDSTTATASSTALSTEPTAPPPVTTSDEALARMLEGNSRFVANQTTDLDEGTERRIAVSNGQHPFATVLGCVDSRVPVELVFDQGLGDLVVVRSAGQVLDRSVTASIEFGVAELGTPLLLVLGHQRCGAVGATVSAFDADHPETEGQIGYLIDALTPAVQQTAGLPGDHVNNAVHANIDLVVAELSQSSVLAPLVDSGTLKLVGGYYDLDSGLVTIS
jgi:carbonic anhydrase